jgi:anti-sigma B factor antagonist
MNVSITTVDSAIVVTAVVELDLVSAPQLDGVLTEGISQASARLVLDLSAVTFLDSTGLGTVVKALKRCREKDLDFRVVVSTERVRKVFEITGLDSLIALSSALDDALNP